MSRKLRVKKYLAKSHRAVHRWIFRQLVVEETKVIVMQHPTCILLECTRLSDLKYSSTYAVHWGTARQCISFYNAALLLLFFNPVSRSRYLIVLIEEVPLYPHTPSPTCVGLCQRPGLLQLLLSGISLSGVSHSWCSTLLRVVLMYSAIYLRQHDDHHTH